MRKIEKLEQRVESIFAALGDIERRSVDHGRQHDVERNVISGLRQSVERMSSEIVFLRGKIDFLEGRDRSVAEKLSRLEPEIASLKKMVESLHRDVEFRVANATTASITSVIEFYFGSFL